MALESKKHAGHSEDTEVFERAQRTFTTEGTGDTEVHRGHSMNMTPASLLIKISVNLCVLCVPCG
jgi:hypothetical protein